VPFTAPGNVVSLEQMLAEVEDLLRTMPPRETIRHELPENFAWLGRASALVSMWNGLEGIAFTGYLAELNNVMARPATEAFRKIIVTLHKVQHDLRMRTAGPLSAAVERGAHFDYFDAVRQILQQAKLDLLVIDPYLDVDFVGRYLPMIAKGLTVRLLTTDKKLATLLPAVDAFVAQYGSAIQVREHPDLHDRYVIVDGAQCYQSGASFKDGPRNADTTVTQIVDLFAEVKAGYEKRWLEAKVHRQ
jgi:hypothetical protein